MLLLQHAMIAPLLVLVASIIHFATQHQLQKKEGRLIDLANPLQYEKNMREHIPSNARGIMLLLQHAMVAPLLRLSQVLKDCATVQAVSPRFL